MALGDNPWSVDAAYAVGLIIDAGGITVNVKRPPTTATSDLDGFLEPINPSPDIQFTADVVIQSQTAVEQYSVGGGRTIQNIEFFTASGQFQENDVVLYQTHEYKVDHIAPAEIGGVMLGDFVTTSRLVEGV